MKRCMRTHKNV